MHAKKVGIDRTKHFGKEGESAMKLEFFGSGETNCRKTKFSGRIEYSLPKTSGQKVTDR